MEYLDCPDQRIFYQKDQNGLNCEFSVSSDGFCCDKTDFRKILEDCKLNPELKSWRNARNRCQEDWRRNHEMLTWPDEEDDDDSMVFYSPSFSQAIMDLFLGKGYLNYFAEDAVEKFEFYFEGGEDKCLYSKRLEEGKGSKEFDIAVCSLALVITHFFMVKKESCTDALIGESSSHRNKFVVALKTLAKNSLEFYIKNSPKFNFVELYDDVNNCWLNRNKKTGLYIQHLENFTTDVKQECYQFIKDTVHQICAIDPRRVQR